MIRDARVLRVGTGITVDGETVPVAADPMLDAWTAAGTGGP